MNQSPNNTTLKNPKIGSPWNQASEVSRMTINGEDYFDVADLNNATLYASPYLVINRQEYTKHIYAGSKRIVSKLAVGLESSIVDPLEYTVEYDDGSYNDLASGLNEYFLNNLSCTEISSENVGYDINLEIIEQNHATSAEEEENDIYFYHTDHLGSSSWITYTDGSVTQHMQNLPFGEPFIDQRATSYDIRYKFTGKEMDSETGYQYFGARYYNSDISVWLSVDPLADKYPSMSSYMYTAGNPVMLVDPDGRKWGKPGEDENNNSDRKQADEMRNNLITKRDEYKSQYDAKYKEMQDYSGDRSSQEYKDMKKEAQELYAGYSDMQNGIAEIDRITNDDNYYTFSGNNNRFNSPSVEKNSEGTFTITINYNSSSEVNKVHEVVHAAQIVDGKITIHQNGNKYEFRSDYTLPNLERSAYLRQYFYNKNSMPVKIGSFKEIISLEGIEGYLRKINKKLGYEAYKF
jgi:RHS repeat-associated protein